MRLGHDAIADALVERARHDRLEQHPRIVVSQPADDELRQPVEVPLAARLAHREDQPDRLRAQPARHERERLRRRRVEPLRVVDDAHQRSLLGRVGQQAQDRQPDQEAIRSVARAQAERRAERILLRTGKALEAIHERRTQLLQHREGELHLRLHARRPDDLAPRRALHQMVQQRALADAGLTAQHQRPARARAHARHELIQRRALGVPAEQIACGRGHLPRLSRAPRLRKPSPGRGRSARSMSTDPITADELVPNPYELIRRNGTPDAIAEWKALADGLLTDQPCAFHRNVEISSRYAWIYTLMPACLKWAGMAAFASHHVRLALFPFRLDTDRTGYVDIPHSLHRTRALLLSDINTIRETNSAIFDDIFWAHLAYGTAEDGLARLRSLLAAEPHYAPVLAGFEAIDRGYRVLEAGPASAEARRAAEEDIWKGNVQLLEHEQRALVQPNLDRLSCAFARLFSIGSALTFEVRGARQEALYFTSFYGYALTRGVRQALRAQTWPRITRFDDRWRWIETSIVPRFRRLDADARLVDASLGRIFDQARDYASNPCVRAALSYAATLTSSRRPPPTAEPCRSGCRRPRARGRAAPRRTGRAFAAGTGCAAMAGLGLRGDPVRQLALGHDPAREDAVDPDAVRARARAPASA